MSYELEIPSLDRRLRIDELQAYVERIMSHQVLKEEFVLPALSRLQLWLGALILAQVRIGQTARERILAAMILMYHGLSLHESVSEGREPQQRRRQLTVLGGDYLSSLFYRLLAEAERLDMIRLFSSAVARINEAKVSLRRPVSDGPCDEPTYLREAWMVQGALLHTLCEGFLPGEKTRAFVQAAITASVYDRELERGGDAPFQSLADVLLSEIATADEKRVWFTVHAGSTTPDKRIAATLHAKYGTFSRMVEGFRDSLNHLRALSVDLFGPEAWPSVERLFSSIHFARGATPSVNDAVEGG